MMGIVLKNVCIFAVTSFGIITITSVDGSKRFCVVDEPRPDDGAVGNVSTIMALSVVKAPSVMRCAAECRDHNRSIVFAYHHVMEDCVLAADQDTGPIPYTIDISDKAWVYYADCDMTGKFTGGGHSQNANYTAQVSSCVNTTGWQHYFEGSCYMLEPAPQTWWDAANICSNQHPGSHLVTLSHGAERDFVISVLEPYTGLTDTIWIGGEINLLSGLFEWVNGEPLGWMEWSSTEPTMQTGEDCLAMYGPLHTGKGLMINFNCSTLYASVCEVEDP